MNVAELQVSTSQVCLKECNQGLMFYMKLNVQGDTVDFFSAEPAKPDKTEKELHLLKEYIIETSL